MTNEERYPVPCPRDYCGAGVGEPCRSSMGNVTMTHMPRRDAAREKGLECDSPDPKEIRRLNRKPKRKPDQRNLF